MKLALFLIPLAAFAQLGASPGSLYSASGRLADAARDVRASEVNDLVTIVVNEAASAVVSGASNSSRKSSVNTSITGAAGALSPRLTNLLGVTNDIELAGTGTTSRNLTLSTTISARVIEVQPNGTLVIEGTRDIGVNSDKQTLTVRGLVRPADLTPTNTINSVQVANLQIKVNGKGVVGDAVRRPHFLYRLLLGLLPF
ncbi:MAG TPA: flagellar basal body L-ring protein FlgH [Bryobacteraceae bacterium]|nr:flagellar basal body L-ring protein FlgH [Bryobacteraceae bacterium]